MNWSITKTFIDIKPGAAPVRINASMYDNNSRLVVMTVKDGGRAFDMTGLSARVEGTRADGTGFMSACTIGDGTVSFLITKEMTNSAGDQKAEIILFAPDNHRIGTANFIIRVEPAALNEDSEISPEDETLINQYITSLTEKIDEAMDLVETAEQAAASAEASSGSAGRSADSAQHNALKAEQYASSAKASADRAESAAGNVSAQAQRAESAAAQAASSASNAAASAAEAGTSAGRARNSMVHAAAYQVQADRSASDAQTYAAGANAARVAAESSRRQAAQSASSASSYANAAQSSAESALADAALANTYSQNAAASATEAEASAEAAAASAEEAESSLSSLTNEVASVRDDLDDITGATDGLTRSYANATPMTYTIYQNRVKIIDAFYTVENGYMRKVIILKITTNSITSANTWTLGNLAPYANLKTGQAYIDYTATSLSGEDVSSMTFRQTSGTINNFSVLTTDAVSEGQGGVILLKSKQAINYNTNAIADTEYPVKLINDTELSNELYNADFASANYGWLISTDSLASLSGYSYIMIRVYGGSSVAVHGLSETLSSFGYAVLDSTKNVLASGGETPGMIIDTPDNGYWLIFTYPTNDNISFIPYFKKKVVVLGDSWSDNDPDHTTYTKWTTLLQQDGRYSVKVYAQNGSSISGSTPNYAQNGNVLGQINQLKADDIDDIDFIIIFGGINDFRSGVSSDTLTSAFLSHLSTLNQMYPNANIICVLNHQVFVTLEQWTYMQTVKRAIRNQSGFPCYTTFGWVKATDFISDYVHPDNDGYKNIYSNMLAIVSGGTPLFIPNTGIVEATSTVNGAITLTITELFTNDDFQRKINMNVTGVTATGTATITTDRSCGLLANIPFESFPQLIISSLNRAFLTTGIARGTSPASSTEANKQATSFAIGMAHANFSGDYIGVQIPII